MYHCKHINRETNNSITVQLITNFCTSLAREEHLLLNRVDYSKDLIPDRVILVLEVLKNWSGSLRTLPRLC